LPCSHELFAIGKRYQFVAWAYLIGFLVPVPFWIVHKLWPRLRADYLYTPVIWYVHIFVQKNVIFFVHVDDTHCCYEFLLVTISGGSASASTRPFSRTSPSPGCRSGGSVLATHIGLPSTITFWQLLWTEELRYVARCSSVCIRFDVFFCLGYDIHPIFRCVRCIWRLASLPTMVR